MNTKVVVLGAQDVAAMRKAHKEAETAYFQAKVGALEFVGQEMQESGKWYSASELSQMSGLTSGEIAAQFAGGARYCKASSEAGLHGRIATAVDTKEIKFVQLLPDGTINPDRVMSVNRRQVVYKFRK